MRTQKTKDSITITFGKRDYIYLAIIFVVIIAAVMVAAFVPRYYKLKYEREIDAAKNKPAANTKPMVKPQSGEPCNTAKVIYLLKDINDYHNFYSKMLALDNTLLTSHTQSAHFAQAEAIATTLLPQLENMQTACTLNEDALYTPDDLYNLLTSFYNTLDKILDE